MKLYGTLSELVAAVFRKGGKDVKIEPAAQSGSGPIVITIPDVGSNAANLVTTGDTGTVTSTMIANGTIVDGDINAAAGIVDTKLATISTAGKVSNSATTATNSNTPSTIVARDGSGDFSAGTITASLTGNVTGNVSGSAASFTGSLSGEVTGTQSATVVADDVIDNANIKSNAAIVDTKLATISTAGKVSGSAITSGTIGGTTSVNTTGTIAASTLTSSNTTTAMQVYINGTGNNGFLELEGQTVSGVAAPTNGEARLFAGTDGKIYVRKAGSTQAEELGAGGSGEINLVDNSSDAGSWVGTNATVTTNTTAANNPLSGTIDSSIAVASSTSGGYAYYRFSMPAALKQRKLKLEWYQIAASLTSGAYRVEVYTNAASDYSGAYTELALSTDSGGNSPIPNLNGKYSTTFDTTSADYYEIRVVRTAASAATLYIANVVCGPGIQPQGAVVGEWVSYTPTYANVTLGTGATNQGRWRRVGDTMEFQGFLVLGTGGDVTGPLEAYLPTGYTVNTTVTPANSASAFGASFCVDISTNNRYVLTPFVRSTTSIAFQPDGVANITTATVPFDWTVSDQLLFSAIVPIAEWAGSGTVQLAQNDVEYASNSSATTASDSTTFAYGPSGFAIQAFAPTGLNAITKRVQFQSPIQDSDQIFIEFSTSNGGWAAAGQSSNVPAHYNRNDAGTTAYGVAFRRVSGAANQLDVEFYSAPVPGDTWSGTSAFKWRVRKASAGAAVGFGIHQPGVSSGLVSASGLLGQTNGNAIASGYVGERANPTTQTFSVSVPGTLTVTTLNTLVLTSGIWMVYGFAQAKSGTLTSGTSCGLALSTNGASFSPADVREGLVQYPLVGTSIADLILATFRFLNVASTTTVTLCGRQSASSGSSNWTANEGISMYAVRIA